MKNCTHLLFQGKNKIKMFFLLIFSLFANTVFAQSTYDCNNCTSNDIRIEKVELVSSTPDGLGGYLPLPTTCLSGTPIDGYLKVTLDQNATTRYGTQIEADVYVDNVFQQHIRYESCATTSSGTYFIYLPNAPTSIQWSCGEVLSLKNIFIGWGSSVASNVCNVGDCELGPKCFKYDLSTNFIVITPIKPDFTALGTCPPNSSAQSYTFTSTATGGVTCTNPPPYSSFKWDITKNGVPISNPTLPDSPFYGNPLTIDFSNYGGAGDYEVTLTVVDCNTPPTTAVGLPKTISVTSCCVPSATCLLSPINTSGCSIPSPFLDPLLVFNYNACGKTVTMTSSDSGDTLICSDGDEADFTRTYTLLFDGVPFATCAQSIKISDTTAPVLPSSLPQDTTVSCDNVPPVSNLTANDNCSGNITVLGVDSITPTSCASQYVIKRTWTFTDACGNPSSHTQTITVQDTTKPVFNGQLPADVTVQCDSVPAPVVLTASDNCDNNVQVIYSESFAGQNDACSANYTITRNWSVTDCAGNNQQHTQVVTVQDTTKPVFNGQLPADVTVQCDSVPAPMVLTASDNCDDKVQIQYVENKISNEGKCTSDYTLERIWTATDCARNAVTHKQLVKVIDTEAPFLPNPISEVLNVKCDKIPEKPELVFDDNCSSNITVVYTESEPQNQNEYGYVIIRTWVATDDCENSTTITQTINVSIEAFSYVYGSVCNTEAPVDLFSFLEENVETTGTWLDVNNSGGLNGSILDPKGINTGFYVYRYTIHDGNCPRIIEVYMTIDDDCVVLPCGITDLKISKVVTPGNDTYNDYFEIGGIDPSCGFTYDIKLFNRWGALIYQNANYQNDWSGKADQAISSSNLPAGTYYYIINIVNSGFDILNGYFYLGTKN